MQKLKSVLIIDDDPMSNYINERLFRHLQIAEQVRVLTDGRLGLEHIAGHCGSGARGACPELVILDQRMPGMGGLEMMETLHGSGMLQGMRTVFLLLAAHMRPGELEKFRALGVQEHTAKPLTAEKAMEAYRRYWADDTVRDHASPSAGHSGKG